MRRISSGSLLLALIFVAACETPTTAPARDTSGLAVLAAKGGGGGAPSQKVKSVSVSPSSAAIAVGGSAQITATSKPAGASFTWASSNNSVATVTQAGLVSGIAPGTASITAAAGGKSAAASISVTGPPPAGVVLLAAGDIADCNNNNDEATAQILDANTGTIALLGDNVYETGTSTEFANCYHPTWGRHKARTMPSAGNHEYGTPNAAGYYEYFGAAAGDPTKGYYSYNLGEWHIVVLNSNITRDAASTQVQWLRADLAANTGKACTLAYWHHPRFSSGSHGNNTSVQAFWDALYDFSTELILVGHDHDYERFAPQTPAAAADPVRGIRQFVVGTGGRSHYGLSTLKANSEVFNGTTYGVLKLTLSASSYAWQFLPVAGQTFTDSGSRACH